MKNRFKNKGIITKVNLVPEEHPRYTNDYVRLFPLSNVRCKHILMVQRMAYVLIFFKILISNPQNLPISG